jgi:putative flippase GtrA
MPARVQIVVPCYQEGKRLDRQAFADFVRASNDISLLFVNDGSTDDTSRVLAELRAEAPEKIQVIELATNQGKGEAVRTGILAAMDAGAEMVGYWDADLATPLHVIPLLVRTLDEDPRLEIVLGARVALLGRRIHRDAIRHYLGRVFATTASITLNLPVYDTQCGAKLLRVCDSTRACFRDSFGSRWIFDVEMLARYLASGGSAEGLFEYAIPQWTDIGGSKIRTKDWFRAIGEMASIYRRYPLNQPFRILLVLVSSAFSRYVSAGAFGTTMHYLMLLLTVELMHVQPAVGAVAGALAGAGVNYVLNYHLTFVSRASHYRTIPKFMIVAALGTLVSGLGVNWAAQEGVHYLPAQLACTALVLTIGFFLNRVWTFVS